ncbi:GNAT family N-acetyltransferase [Heyndrickxia sp. FSL K6-6286]|jgi:GNAT superfamily N-acetyltransferase|uniref:GNAT family N-acetyltransferase n=1 Tax=Heyndrickxia sp. FSL K6-6286 TaxID=2921510 RepID=UPI00315B03F8
MIYELQIENYQLIKPLLAEYPVNPVIGGVIEGNNLGRIFVDHPQNPSSALVWAKNEMFYLIGNSDNELFNSSLESLIFCQIKPEALAIGDDCFNLELYPFSKWERIIPRIFTHSLSIGERVPFEFDYDRYISRELDKKVLPDGYQCQIITEELIKIDINHVMKKEILKFWDSVDSFFNKGIGVVITKEREIIGTCLSVFVSGSDFEIGINVYQTEHRGKGLATYMAERFLEICLEKGGRPHWTTENFRSDSIAIANKLGFRQLPNYRMFFLPF